MPMDRSNSSSGGSVSPTASTTTVVLSVECLRGSSKADEWTPDMLQTGDIVEQISIGALHMRSPFKNGRAGVQKLLHASFKNKDTSIRVLVRRGPALAELLACIVPNTEAGSGGGKKQYMLRSIVDPNYAVGFVDRTEAECLALQASRNSRLVNALATTQLHDGYVSYSWEKKMQEYLVIPNSSCFLSILLLPKASGRDASRYHDVEDTLARANAWLYASQASGVPIVFMNIQTESLLTKISGDTASSTVNAGSLAELSDVANVSLYGFEDYHGVDIGVVRAVRLWYSPLAGEIPVVIKLREGDMKLGFAISRTEEGFIYVSSVIDDDDNAPSTRSGLSSLYKEATRACRLLIVSRVSNQKVLPWMVSTTGAVRCFDTISLSQKLSLHRHAHVPVILHVFSWDRDLSYFHVPSRPSTRPSTISPASMSLPPETQLAHSANTNQVVPLPSSEIPPPENRVPNDGPAPGLARDTAGESSFKFHDFELPNNWV